MSLEYEEAVAEVTGPGQLFEVVDGVVGGTAYRLFANAPPTLGQVFAGARGEQSTFLVYEDERWTLRRDHAPRRRPGPRAGRTPSGSSKGDRVGIAMRNLPEWIVSFAAILSIGAVVGLVQRLVDRERARLRGRATRASRC